MPTLIILATMLDFFHDVMWGSLAALTAELFIPRLHYGGASIGLQLAAAFADGPRR